VGRNYRGLFHIVKFNTNVAFLQPRANQNRVASVRAKGTQSCRVLYGLNVIYELEVCEVVHVDLVFEDYDHPVSTELHSFYVRTKAELPDASILVIVPDHHFIWRESWVSASPNQSKDVASEEHLNARNTALLEVFPVSLFEGITVVNPKSFVRSACNATIILVKPHEEELVCGFVVQVHLSG